MTKTVKPEYGEIATTNDGRDITRGYVEGLALLQPLDSVLRARGGNHTLYDDVLRDDQVISTLQQRHSALISREWEVLPGGTKRRDKQAAASLRANLDALEWDRATHQMLYGVYYGYAVAELMWVRDGATVVIGEVKVRDRRRFGFAPDFSLRMLTGASPEGETLPEHKFWRLATGATHGDEPYGLGLAHWLYWPVTFKRQGLRFWLTFLEKFGAPTAVGKFPQNATPGERASLLAATQAIQSDSGVILPEGMVIELLEASRGGTPGHESMIRLMDSAIAKVVLSQTMTTDIGSSEAQARIHQDVAQAVVKADADLVCGSFNRGPARWLTDWNYPGAAYPRVWRRVEDEEDLKPLAERDKLLFDMGFRPTLSYIKETYGGDWTEAAPAGAPAGAPLAGAKPDTPTEPAAFAERDAEPTAVDALTQALAEQTAPAWSAMLDRIRAIVDQHIDDWQSLEALRDALLAAYGDLPVDDLAEVMSAGFALAELAGRFDVREERAP